MAIRAKCGGCGRFVTSGESCCGEIKKVKIERRNPDEVDTANAKSLAEALFGPKGEIIEEEIEDEEESKDEEEREGDHNEARNEGKQGKRGAK